MLRSLAGLCIRSHARQRHAREDTGTRTSGRLCRIPATSCLASHRRRPGFIHQREFVQPRTIRIAQIPLAIIPNQEVWVLHLLVAGEAREGTDFDSGIGDWLFVPLSDYTPTRTNDRYSGTPCGKLWTYIMPMALMYLHRRDMKSADLEAERAAETSPL
jgi:hypothetical protein